MKLTFPALTALAIPVASDAWTLGPRMRLWGPSLLDTAMISPSQLIRQQQELMDRSFSYTSPRYEITDNDDSIKISLDVPGVNADDISVTLEEDGQVLSISGHRELEKEGYSYSSKFSQSFSLDPSVELDKFKADLDKGVLVITAPKDKKQLEQKVRKIPIMQSAEDKAATKALDEAENADKKEIKVEKATVETK